MSRWPEVRLGDLVAAVRTPIIPVARKEYVEIGVRSFGRGVFRKPTTTAEAIGSKKVFEVGPDLLIINIVFAWEGAVARTTSEHVGTIASHRFPNFRVDPERADLDYILFMLRSERGQGMLAAASPGSAGRNRTLSTGALLDNPIPLPPLGEQRRIVRWLDGIDVGFRNLTEQGGPRARDRDAVDAAIEAVIQKRRNDGWKSKLICEVADVNPKRSEVRVDRVSFVTMAAVSDLGYIADPIDAAVSDLKGGYRQFLRGDVIFARITPCMENGKSALFDGPCDIGYGSTEFHVLRPSLVSAQWLHVWLRRRSFRAEAMGAFQGTAGQQRVPAAFFDSAEILLPPSEADERQVVAEIGRLVQLQESLRSAGRRRRALAQALLPSALNQVFGSLA